MNATEWSKKIQNGDKLALSRAITAVESESNVGKEILSKIYSMTGNAKTIGFTGSAGVGKSTLVRAVIKEAIERGKKTAVIAIDPSSPFSEGAILGDRIRMQDLTNNELVFIRSMASRKGLGGVAASSVNVMHLFDAAGFDNIIIETVGAGQDEIDIVNIAQTTVIVVNPSAGDEIQSMKSGLMEIGQIFAVNKSDLPGSDAAIAHINALIHLAGHVEWQPPALKVIAQNETGIKELVDAIDDHQFFLRQNSNWPEHKKIMAKRQVQSLIKSISYADLLDRLSNNQVTEEIIQKVADGKLDPISAAETIFNKFSN
jgi:LAO/AO transport system kinase